MKDTIHPQVHTDCTVTCVCGNSFTTISTKKSISVEICSSCHPFYTGQQKFVDTEGRIDKFAKKVRLAKEKKEETDKLKLAKKSKKSDSQSKTSEAKVSLKDILKQAKEAPKDEESK